MLMRVLRDDVRYSGPALAVGIDTNMGLGEQVAHVVRPQAEGVDQGPQRAGLLDRRQVPRARFATSAARRGNGAAARTDPSRAPARLELCLVGEDRRRIVVWREVQAQLAVDDIDVDRVARYDVAGRRKRGDRHLPHGAKRFGVEQRDTAELEGAVLRDAAAERQWMAVVGNTAEVLAVLVVDEVARIAHD